MSVASVKGNDRREGKLSARSEAAAGRHRDRRLPATARLLSG